MKFLIALLLLSVVVSSKVIINDDLYEQYITTNEIESKQDLPKAVVKVDSIRIPLKNLGCVDSVCAIGCFLMGWPHGRCYDADNCICWT